MNRLLVLEATLCAGLGLVGSGCGQKVTAQQSVLAGGGTGPAPAPVQQDMDASNFKVEHPEQFPLVAATQDRSSPELNVTGVVQPDVSRQVPVP